MQNDLEKYVKRLNLCKEEVDRISWHEYFILQAYMVSNRSLDAQTQCGCVIVKPDKTIVGSGYNSFIANIDDSVLPNLRPEKYPFMIHAEHNAILNCAKNGISTNECLAFVTGPPCSSCFQYMHQAGISEIYYYDGNYANMTCNTEYENQISLLKKLSNMRVYIIPQSSEFSDKIFKIKSCR